MKVSYNGKILDETDAPLLISDKSVWYSFGVYETIKVLQGSLMYLDEHIERLYFSAKTIGIIVGVEATEMARWVREYADECDLSDHLIKICVYGQVGEKEPAKCYIFALNLTFHARSLYKKGVSAILVDGERYAPSAKTLNSLPAFIAHGKARSSGAFEALMVDTQGHIREGASSNVFAVIDGTVVTPDDKYVLKGVTRGHVIVEIERLGVPLTYGVLPVDTLLTSVDELFVTATVTNVMPIVSVNGKPIREGKVGPVTRRIMEGYSQRQKKMYTDDRHV